MHPGTLLKSSGLPLRRERREPLGRDHGACLLGALLLAIAFQWPLPVPAQAPAASLRVATRIVPPFVTQENGKLSGFSVDLWNAIAGELKVASTFSVKPSVQDLLDELKAHRADVGIAAISITSEREKDLNFSQPMFNAGLQIMVKGQGTDPQANPVRGLLALLFSPVMLVWLGIALAMVVIPAHLIWLLERNHPEGIIPDRRYVPGIFHASWWAAGTLATQADSMPRSGLARIMAIFWMFIGVVFVAYFTAQVTASLTVQQLQGNIHGPEDLPGKRVATVRRSTSAAYLAETRADVRETDTPADGIRALLDGQVDAVVYDAPVLLYYAGHEGKGKVSMVGSVFRKEDYGIAFPPDSKWAKPVDLALLRLRENGTFQKLYDKWFGSD